MKPKRFSIRQGILGIGLWVAWSSPAHAVLILRAGHHLLQPNTPDQVIQFEIENTSDPVDVAALNLDIQIADGGPSVGGLVVGPHITAVDLITDTPFASNHEPPIEVGAGPQWAFWSILTAFDTVTIPAGSSTLATLTVDTTGLQSPGASWPLFLSQTLNGDTQLFDPNADVVEMRIESGSIRWIPVPDAGPFPAALWLTLVAWGTRQVARASTRMSSVWTRLETHCPETRCPTSKRANVDRAAATDFASVITAPSLTNRGRRWSTSE